MTRAATMQKRGTRVSHRQACIEVRVPNTEDNGSHCEQKWIEITIWVDPQRLADEYAAKAYRNKNGRVEECKGGVHIVAGKSR
jgi:hypothetical protein